MDTHNIYLTAMACPNDSAIEVGKFIGEHQRIVLAQFLEGEEGPHFVETLRKLNERIRTMPATYGQADKGDDAVAYLHYFRGGMDWWITEKDMEPEQLQAFGMVDLGNGSELGYISIEELISANVEIDLYWEPKTLSEIKAKRSNH